MRIYHLKALAACGLLIMILSLSGHAQRDKSVLLPAEEAKAITDQCSRPAPEKFTDTWVPSAEQIRRMEQKLADVKKLKAKTGGHIDDPEGYHLQYIGLVLDGRKLIYINAFSGADVFKSWRKNAVIVCDGGEGFWGVLYDPGKEAFFDLAINGNA